MSRLHRVGLLVAILAILAVPASAFSQDTLINVVQWTEAMGGNGHWYGIVPIIQPWTAQRDLAGSLTYDNSPGYLATITSPEENQFIVDSLLKVCPTPPSLADEFYIGGHLDGVSWDWLTGETLSYTNWKQYEPSGDGAALAVWGASYAYVGQWNDCPDNGPVGTVHELWALVEFGEYSQPPPDTVAVDTLINLVQWTAATGGNDHWYGIIPIVQPWTAQRDLAASLTHNGVPGHLATIETAAENKFIADNLLIGTRPPTIADELYLGGEFYQTNWSWITGEPFIYSNWNYSEPSGDGTALAIYGSTSGYWGKWNDVGHDGPVGSIQQLWALVEFEAYNPPPDTISVDTLTNVVQWTSAMGGNDHWYGIVPIVQPWTAQRSLAASLTYQDIPGHLATIGSAEENQFIYDSLLAVIARPPTVADEFYIGGHNDLGIWGWITGEAMGYTHWNSGEPSGDGSAVGIWGATSPYPGLWNDCPDNGPVGSVHELWAVVEFGLDSIVTPPPDTISVDTLTNLVQWTSAMGGNDHWYGIIPIVQRWTAQRDLAASLSYDGEPGHLVTIGSEQENQFIYDNLLVGNTDQPSIADEFYIGGHYNGTDWYWLTGEPFDYTNWKMYEPSGDGTALAIWGASYPYGGQWNDCPDNGPVGSIHQLWALIEFGVDTPPGDSLIFPGMSVATGQAVQPVVSKTLQPIAGCSVPIKIPSFGRSFGISTEGLITQNWNYQIKQVKADSGFIFVALFNTNGLLIPAGENTLFNITFEAGNPSCSEDFVGHWDTTLMSDQSRQLLFADTNQLPIHPGFASDRDAVTIAPAAPGDGDNSGYMDIGDLVFTVEYMFGGGPAPFGLSVLDVNGDCSGPDIADLVRMVEYLFGNSGATLECGCVASAKGADYPRTEAVKLYTVYTNGTTSLYMTSSEPVRGVQVQMSVSSESATVSKAVPENIDLAYGYDGDMLKAGLLDLSGTRAIGSGTTRLLDIAGSAHLHSALVADQQGNPVAPMITDKADLLPSDYALYQNYPNPFNPTTEIRFSLPQSGSVLLEIYNIQGQKVTTLLDGVMPAGEHQITWDGTNEAGSSVASGVYFYRIEVNGFQQSKKMLLMK